MKEKMLVVHILGLGMLLVVFISPCWFTYDWTGGRGDHWVHRMEKGLWRQCLTYSSQPHEECHAVRLTHGKGLVGQMLMAVSFMLVVLGLLLSFGRRCNNRLLQRHRLAISGTTLAGGALGCLGTVLYGRQSHEDEDLTEGLGLAWCYYLSYVSQITFLVVGLHPVLKHHLRPPALPAPTRDGDTPGPEGSRSGEDPQAQFRHGPPPSYDVVVDQPSSAADLLPPPPSSREAEDGQLPPYEVVVHHASFFDVEGNQPLSSDQVVAHQAPGVDHDGHPPSSSGTVGVDGPLPPAAVERDQTMPSDAVVCQSSPTEGAGSPVSPSETPESRQGSSELVSSQASCS